VIGERVRRDHCGDASAASDPLGSLREDLGQSQVTSTFHRNGIEPKGYPPGIVTILRFRSPAMIRFLLIALSITSRNRNVLRNYRIIGLGAKPLLPRPSRPAKNKSFQESQG